MSPWHAQVKSGHPAQAKKMRVANHILFTYNLAVANMALTCLRGTRSRKVATSPKAKSASILKKLNRKGGHRARLVSVATLIQLPCCLRNMRHATHASKDVSAMHTWVSICLVWCVGSPETDNGSHPTFSHPSNRNKFV